MSWIEEIIEVMKEYSKGKKLDKGVKYRDTKTGEVGISNNIKHLAGKNIISEEE